MKNDGTVSLSVPPKSRRSVFHLRGVGQDLSEVETTFYHWRNTDQGSEHYGHVRSRYGPILDRDTARGSYYAADPEILSSYGDPLSRSGNRHLANFLPSVYILDGFDQVRRNTHGSHFASRPFYLSALFYSYLRGRRTHPAPCTMSGFEPYRLV